MKNIIRRAPSVGFALLLSPQIAAAQPTEAPTLLAAQDLSQLSIEDLAQLPVRAASKREEPLSAAPTALYVITGEEILASAATSLPEALRLAPNLNVQQLDAHQYAVSARGFNGVESSNKLLVLIDGRSIYTPLASSVFWELHNRLLEDVRQIEVISGPGGTLYGPNAVNGVVSISTRDARDTLGGLVRATAGDRERTLGARYGARLGSDGAIRFYGQYFDREDQPAGPGPVLGDRFRGWQLGFRADFGSAPMQIVVQGDIFDNETGSLPEDGNRGHNLQVRMRHDLGDNSAIRLRAYYDMFEREVLLTRDMLETFDFEGQYDLETGAHTIVAGVGARTTRDEFANNLNQFQLDPASRRLWVFNAFAQDRIALSPALSLTLGLKAEQTSFTGVELLPNLRVAWHPNERMLLWGAVSRAVRTPSRIDRDLQAPPFLAPGDDFVSEKLVAFEAGYRGQPTDWATLSVSLFYNRYDDIRTTEFSPGNVLPIRLSNGLRGQTWGVEAWGTAQLMPWWRLNLGLSTLWKDFEAAPGRIDLGAGSSLGQDPNFQLFARSQISLTDRLEINAGLRFIDGIEGGAPVDSYVEADARIGYRLSEAVELYVAGSNLLHRDHLESGDPGRAQLAVRSLYAGTRLRF